MNDKNIIPATRGWYVESSKGSSLPVIAWAFDAELRPRPITAEGIAADGEELVSPEGKRHRVVERATPEDTHER